MDLIADRGRRVAIEELNTTRLLAHARKQAQQRKLDDVLIVDVDEHHYENDWATAVPAGRPTSRASLRSAAAARGATASSLPMRSGFGRSAGASRAIPCVHRRRLRKASCATSSSGIAGWTR